MERETRRKCARRRALRILALRCKGRGRRFVWLLRAEKGRSGASSVEFPFKNQVYRVVRDRSPTEKRQAEGPFE